MSPIDNLSALVDDLRAMWSGEDASELTPAQTIGVNLLLGRIKRTADGAHAKIAAEIARQSRPELGPESLAKSQGFRSPTALIAATTGTRSGDAARLLQVGEATAPRMLLSGERAPARHPHVGEASRAGTIGTDAASSIISMLDRVALRAQPGAVAEAEKTLVEQAPGLTLEQLSRVLLRAEAWLDPDGVEPREDELRSKRSLTMREDAGGMLLLTARLDPASGAPIKAAVEALVAQELRAAQDAAKNLRADAANDATTGASLHAASDTTTGASAATATDTTTDARAAAAADTTTDTDAPRRSIVQMQADALVRICEHILGCEERDLPLAGATVVVRMTLEDLVEGTGTATIDGMAAPVSVGTARRMAAAGRVIPCVLGADSEILDWGRAKRTFTRSQRLAFVERDGGCAMCGAPPGQTNVHHIRWWARDSGPTDLANGILLCTSCHHRIHDNGWEIRIDGPGVDAKVWFVPPAQVDPVRTPRLGGRRRFGFAA